MSLATDLGLSIRVSEAMFEYVRLVTGTSSPGIGEGGDWWRLQQRGFPGVVGVNKGIPTISLQSKLYSQSNTHQKNYQSELVFNKIPTLKRGHETALSFGIYNKNK